MELVKKGTLVAKEESLDILFEGAYCIGENTLDGEKEFLKNEVLPLIISQPELRPYVDKINQIQNAKVLSLIK